ncbi:MAG TPA: RnfABCDGE type electron transport complex subunit B [Candidatus Fusicatenibacter merdavium]|uniref:Ion-translocating oxidoreductase complex subunit B n=1 Tax=Candidatus Fusicatenibacter merdavium TaxID=2838600 RepID=A0A9D1XBN4_9FIRM|nr:RnfABCDGE type electron transport complex subunit B [Candidatus Fusicatenibacter merdavium]
MSIQVVLVSVLVVGGAGLIIGLLLGLAGKKFAVEVDERETLVREALPGNNCGGCGYPGCDGAAAAVVKGEAPVTVCPVGGAACAKAIGEIMGQEVGETVRMTAFIKCGGDCEKAKTNYDYTGVEDCAMVPFVPGGGAKKCSYGCLGYGSCVKACAFDAIRIVNGVAVVDKEACKACGVCVRTCPKHLIELVPYAGADYHVVCNSGDKGKLVMDACEIGCIGCKKCEKNCPSEAIKVENGVAHIDYEKCTNCGTCMEVCPRGTIQR